MPNVSVLGPYAQADAVELIKDIRPHCALFLKVWPETYSYTLTEVLRAGVFPLATDIGAVAERIKKLGWGKVFDADADAKTILAQIRALPTLRQSPPSEIGPCNIYKSLASEYYGVPTV